MIQIYDYDGSFLYEIIEDYKDSKTQEEKDKIFNFFCSSIWSSDNKRKTYTKSIGFHVRKDLLNTNLGQMFHTRTNIEYRYYKSKTKDESWSSIVRQKINNIYTRYFDREVILQKEYLDLLKTPKRFYHEWISGADMDVAAVTKLIDESIAKSIEVKSRLQMEKMDLSWNEYKKIVEKFLRRAFDNCKLIGEYEDQSKIISRLDFLTEDHFYVGYICRSLEGEILKWQKQYYGIRDHKKYTRCRQCGSIIEKTGNKRLYCTHCGKEKERTRKRKIAHKYRIAK